MMLQTDSKPWYKSKAVIAGVIIVFVNLWDNALVPMVGQYLHVTLPFIPVWVYSMLAALGIYGRVKADSRIGK